MKNILCKLFSFCKGLVLYGKQNSVLVFSFVCLFLLILIDAYVNDQVLSYLEDLKAQTSCTQKWEKARHVIAELNKIKNTDIISDLKALLDKFEKVLKK